VVSAPATIEAKTFTKLFAHAMRAYNMGPFGIPGNLAVKDAIARDHLAYSGPAESPDAAAIFNRMKARSVHKDFAYRDFVIDKGHLFISDVAANTDLHGDDAAIGHLRLLIERVEAHLRAPITWLQIHMEDPLLRRLVTEMGFTYAGTKVDAYSTLKGLYARLGPDAVVSPEGDHITIGPNNLSVLQYIELWTGDWDHATLTKLEEPPFLSAGGCQAILAELGAYHAAWADHYSTYNIKNSWSAFALRGYKHDDPTDIVKPSEMPRDWKAANPERLHDTCGETIAASAFPETMAIIRAFCQLYEVRPERVRLMRLLAKGGELARHSDITDRGAGTKDGQVCRFHIPLRTSPLVQFQMWDQFGNRYTRHMAEGEIWYLDQRKPHRAVNQDQTVERIHLVFDVYANDLLREALAVAWQGERATVWPDFIPSPYYAV
jgi:hypothetical protein